MRNGQLEGFIGKRSAMDHAVAQIVSPNDSQEVKLRKIYDRVQQFRNTTYEFQKTKSEQPAENLRTFGFQNTGPPNRPRIT